MKTTILALLLSVSSTAYANCKLKVYTTSPYDSVIIHFFKFQGFTLDQCKNLCSTKALLQEQVPPYEIALRCGMKFINEDGTVIKSSYGHLFHR